MKINLVLLGIIFSSSALAGHHNEKTSREFIGQTKVVHNVTSTSDLQIAGDATGTSGVQIAGDATGTSGVQIAGDATGTSGLQIVGDAMGTSGVQIVGDSTGTSGFDAVSDTALRSDYGMTEIEVNKPDVIKVVTQQGVYFIDKPILKNVLKEECAIDSVENMEDCLGFLSETDHAESAL